MIKNIAVRIEQRDKLILFFLFILSFVILVFGLSALLNPSVELSWKTETEVDTLGFDVYRKNLEDNNDFRKITSEIIFAQGSSISGSTYSFTDDGVKSGDTYNYQLYEIQLNGEKMIIDELQIKVQYRGLVEIGISIALLAITLIWVSRK